MFVTGIAAENMMKTHCPAGHPYDEENTYPDPKGARRCRACNRDSVRRYQERSRHLAALDSTVGSAP